MALHVISYSPTLYVVYKGNSCGDDGRYILSLSLSLLLENLTSTVNVSIRKQTLFTSIKIVLCTVNV